MVQSESRQRIRIPVKGMPLTADNPKGNGFVDYVLGMTTETILIEAKRTD
jgi:type I restriction enzyme R subunit